MSNKIPRKTQFLDSKAMKGDQVSHEGSQSEPKRARVSHPSHQDGASSMCRAIAGIVEDQMQRSSSDNLVSAGSGDGGVMNAEAGDGNQQHNFERGRIENGRIVGVKNRRVLYAFHPKRGRFVVNEGFVLVGDERIVCGGARQGFFAAPVPDDVKAQIHMSDSLPLFVDKVLFPNMFMLAPAVRQMAADVAEIASAGLGEIIYPHEVPADEPLPPTVEARVVDRVYRAVVAGSVKKATSASGDAVNV